MALPNTERCFELLSMAVGRYWALSNCEHCCWLRSSAAAKYWANSISERCYWETLSNAAAEMPIGINDWAGLLQNTERDWGVNMKQYCYMLSLIKYWALIVSRAAAKDGAVFIFPSVLSRLILKLLSQHRADCKMTLVGLRALALLLRSGTRLHLETPARLLSYVGGVLTLSPSAVQAWLRCWCWRRRRRMCLAWWCSPWRRFLRVRRCSSKAVELWSCSWKEVSRFRLPTNL